MSGKTEFRAGLIGLIKSWIINFRRPTVSDFMTENLGLANLPLEVLQNITTFLPASAVASLALTSKSMLCKIGTDSFAKLKKGEFTLQKWDFEIPSLSSCQEDRQTFLMLLDKELCSHQLALCHFCQKLHDPQKFSSRYSKNWEVQCVVPPRGIPYYRCQYVNYPAVYMAMKLYRLGLDNTSYMESFSKTITKYWDTCTHQELLTPRIINGMFFLRAQHWFLLLRTTPLRLPDDSQYSFDLCHHAHVSLLSPGDLKQLMVCRLRHVEDGAGCSFCSKLVQCEDCYTEYQVDIKDLGKKGVALVVTQWLDFGDMVTPFSRERKWASHNTWSPRWKADYLPGSLKRAFEGDDFDFDMHPGGQAEADLAIIPRGRWTIGTVVR